MRISDWSSDVCSSDLRVARGPPRHEDGEFALNRHELLHQQRHASAGTLLHQRVGGFGVREHPPAAAVVAAALRLRHNGPAELGSASVRERVCQYVSISVGAVSLKTKRTTRSTK